MTLACVAESIDRLQMSLQGCAENRYRQYRVVFGVICLNVCLYVCNTITFVKLEVESSLLVCVYLQGIRVKFVCQGHRVKVRVIAAKKR